VSNLFVLNNYPMAFSKLQQLLHHFQINIQNLQKKLLKSSIANLLENITQPFCMPASKVPLLLEISKGKGR
jgi:hypothetical protein